MNFSSCDLLTVGILAVDTNGIIVYVNHSYLNFLSAVYSDVLGKHILDIIPHTNLHNVAKTGIPELRVWQETNQGFLFGNRIPIIEDSKVTGALAELILQNTDELSELHNKLQSMENQVSYLMNKLISSKSETDSTFVYQSKSMENVMEKIKKVAPYETTVLITGESGTGKELVSDALYKYSNRVGKPFVKINCAAIPNDLIEAELFGYEKGAFTGANPKGKPGKFELANKGVLFLDEISSMPLNMQVKLLRVLQEKEIEHLGGSDKIKINIKIIAATNENLDKLVKEGKFREDLFYRLNVLTIEIPSLRERTEDIILLSECFLDYFFIHFNKKKIPLNIDAIKLLKKYSWPGNVRELKNVMERLVIMCDGRYITQSDIIRNTSIHHETSFKNTLKEQLDLYEKSIIIDALRKSDGNKTIAAKQLNINRATFYSKLEKYNLINN